MEKPTLPAVQLSSHDLLHEVRSIHLIGVAGIAMGNFAAMLRDSGYDVRGSDQAAYPPMSKKLLEWGIAFRTPYSVMNLEPRPDLVIAGTTIAPDNAELEMARRWGIPNLSFPEALFRLFLRHRHRLVVAGTHGKTTCSALLAHTLAHANLDPGFLIGGIPENFGTGFRRGGSGPESIFVVEGDEYKTSQDDLRPKFLHYRPHTLLCTNLEYDHANVFRRVEDIEESFTKLMDLVPPAGRIFLPDSDERLRNALARSRSRAQIVIWGSSGAWAARSIVQNAVGSEFTPFRCETERNTPIQIGLHGLHNVENALGCYAVLRSIGLTHAQIGQAFKCFRGVKRRTEVIGERAGITIVDDFAHHPTAVRATLCAARQRFPNRSIWAVFEPRSITSCGNVFFEEYGQSFHDADRALIAPAYRCVGGDVLDTHELAKQISQQGTPATAFSSVADILEMIQVHATAGVVVVCMSSGAFEGIQHALLRCLAAR